MPESMIPSELKTFLCSKRSNIYYLQYCWILVNGGRVENVTEEGSPSLYWNSPIAYTIGTCTSVTQAAMREFSRAGVLVGFFGGGGTPLYSANEVEVNVFWLASQNDYRPTEYLQCWVSFWFDEKKRLAAVVEFQKVRCEQTRNNGYSAVMHREAAFSVDIDRMEDALFRFESCLPDFQSLSELMTQEAILTKSLYIIAATASGYDDFTRAKLGGIDAANRFLYHGDYLAYGLVATTGSVVGLPQGLAVMHGKTRFVEKRVIRQRKEVALRKTLLVGVLPASVRVKDVLDAAAKRIHQSFFKLHNLHHQGDKNGNKLSAGLVRMANIAPLVAIAQRLFMTDSPDNYHFHYCVYHNQYPLVMRTHIESRLDATLRRHDQKAIWEVEEIRQVLSEYPERHYIFVMLETTFAEIGWDHDYDFAIAEPSLVRSLIQLAGRGQHHRQIPPGFPNIHILHKNVKTLNAVYPAYYKPSPKNTNNIFLSSDLHDLFQSAQISSLNAVTHIKDYKPLQPKNNIADLEHARLWKELSGRSQCSENYAARWWRDEATRCGQLQKLTPFRQPAPDRQFNWLEEEHEEPRIRQPDERGEGWNTVIEADAVELWLWPQFMDAYALHNHI